MRMLCRLTSSVSILHWFRQLHYAVGAFSCLSNCGQGLASAIPPLTLNMSKFGIGHDSEKGLVLDNVSAPCASTRGKSMKGKSAVVFDGGYVEFSPFAGLADGGAVCKCVYVAWWDWGSARS